MTQELTKEQMLQVQRVVTRNVTILVVIAGLAFFAYAAALYFYAGQGPAAEALVSRIHAGYITGMGGFFLALALLFNLGMRQVMRKSR